MQVQGLEKKFDDNQVLDGITTDICQGEVVAVIGPSGSGKSTFLRSLNLLEVPTGGKILFEGVDITDPKVDINRHRQKIGMVFQQFNLFPHKTVKENIMLAPVTLGLMKEEEASEKAEELLARVGLPDKADAYPDSLSGGQKQRIAIARAMALDPDVIVCDGFVGNTVLKMAEGLYRINKKLGGGNAFWDAMNYENVGGTPVLGVNAPVIIGHGISSARAIKSMILSTEQCIKADLTVKLQHAFKN